MGPVIAGSFLPCEVMVVANLSFGWMRVIEKSFVAAPLSFVGEWRVTDLAMPLKDRFGDGDGGRNLRYRLDWAGGDGPEPGA